MPTNPVLVIHGGAWAMPDDMVDAHLRGVNNALAAGWRVLEGGGSALDAVEQSVVIMEDDETFDAGRGSFLNREGKVQLDALIMDGATLRAGGVGCVERLRNPVRAARKILSDSPHVYFVGPGAEQFAAEHGIPLCDNKDLIIPREIERLRAYQAEAARPLRHSTATIYSRPTLTIGRFLTTPSAPSPSTAMATSPPPRPPAARSTKLPDAWAIPRSSAAAATPTTRAPPSPPPGGASPS